MSFLNSQVESGGVLHVLKGVIEAHWFLHFIKQDLYYAIADVILQFPVIFQLRHRSTCPSPKPIQSNPDMIDSFTLHL